jgi:iron complex transport system permease protein
MVCCVAVFSVALGSTWVSTGDVVRALVSEGGVGSVIVREVRLPRVLLAGIVGGALAVAGVVFQALLRNSLADPFVLGISGGAGLGAVIAVSFGGGITVGGLAGMPVFAFLGALGAITIVYLFARGGGRVNLHTMLLAGVVTNAICSSAIMALTVMLSYDQLQTVMFWLMGHLSTMPLPTVGKLSGYITVGLVVLIAIGRDLNQMSLGESQATILGTNVEWVKRVAFVGASLVTGAAVAAAGLVGFVGLIVPHAVRLAVGPDHRLLIPASFLVGAAFLMLADAVARTVMAPTELPVGVITALIGGPAFLALLMKRTRR